MATYNVIYLIVIYVQILIEYFQVNQSVNLFDVENIEMNWFYNHIKAIYSPKFSDSILHLKL